MTMNMPVITDTVHGPIPPRVDRESWPGVLHTRPSDLAERMGPPPWFTPVIVDERNQVTLIASGPGGGNRPHWHEDFDEWWFILAGELRWELTGGRVLGAQEGDIVWVPRGTTHHIQAVGDETSLRLAVAAHPGIHYYADCGVCGYSDDGPREYGRSQRPPGGSADVTDVVKGPIAPRMDNPSWPGVLHTRPAELIDAKGPPPWQQRLIVDERNIATIMANYPGTGNRPHWHSDFDEWWVVLGGDMIWELTGGKVIEATEGDIVWVPRGTTHHIKNVGDEISLRVAVGMPPGIHYYDDCDVCGYSDDGPRQWDVPLDLW